MIRIAWFCWDLSHYQKSASVGSGVAKNRRSRGEFESRIVRIAMVNSPFNWGTPELFSRVLRLIVFLAIPIHVLLQSSLGALAEASRSWRDEWPRTDFTRHSVELDEIRSGGPPKDGIPAIDEPEFIQLTKGAARGWVETLSDREPVISVATEDDARAYPLRVLMWHEIVNDTVGGRPVTITYCPLCNSSIVYEREIDGRILDFGTTGKLRYSDLVMYDRQTESWWQQFTGKAIVGELAGRELILVPSRVESFGLFRQRFPSGRVLVPNDPLSRDYGSNPYVGYDGQGQAPFLYDGDLPEGIDPMERVVAVETSPGRYDGWTLELLREKGKIEFGDLTLTWEEGQASALDANSIARGREIGNVVVQWRQGTVLVDVPYDVTFAFALHAFRPGSNMHKK